MSIINILYGVTLCVNCHDNIHKKREVELIEVEE